MEAILKLFGDFGVKPVLLIAQVVNFVILIVALRFIIYKPLLKMLDARKKRIDDGLKFASDAEEKLASTEEVVGKIRSKARDEASEVVAAAVKAAKEIQEEAIVNAEKIKAEILAEGDKVLKREKQEIVNQIKSETVDLVVETVQVALERNLSEAEKKKILAKSTKKLT